MHSWANQHIKELSNVIKTICRSNAYESKISREEMRLQMLKNFTKLFTFLSKNKRAQDRLDALNKSKERRVNQDPPQEVIDQLINLYNQGQFKNMAGRPST